MRAAVLLVAVVALHSSCTEKIVEAHKLPGEHIMSKKALAFLDQMDEEPTIEELGPMQPYFYRFFDKGVELYIEGDTIAAVFVYPEGIDGHLESYSGRLAYRLTVNDTRQDVERKIGRPTTTKKRSPWVASFWDNKGICAVYQSTDTTDMSIKIHHFTFFLPVNGWVNGQR